jgi:hypothetical protein
VTETIVEAIRLRRLLRFYYDGHLRIVQPATYGNHATTGNLTLKAYQVQGTSKSRVVPFWSSFIIDQVERLEMLSESFKDNPPGYREDDSQISPIVAQL